MTNLLRNLFLILFLCSISALTLAQENYGKVGDVRYSVLPPNQFERLNPGWVLMDGRPVNNTEYQRLTGQSTIPNGQDQFIRGIDTKNETPRRPGDHQPWATGMPTNTFRTNEENSNHAHDFERYDVGGDTGKVATTSGGGLNRTYQPAATSKGGAHYHAVTGGDEETRPTNIALFIYIKIDN